MRLVSKKMNQKFKKAISAIILAIVYILCVGVLIYGLYIEPMLGLHNMNHWYEYLFAVGLLTVFYTCILISMFCIVLLCEWALNNLRGK